MASSKPAFIRKRRPLKLIYTARLSPNGDRLLYVRPSQEPIVHLIPPTTPLGNPELSMCFGEPVLR